MTTLITDCYQLDLACSHDFCGSAGVGLMMMVYVASNSALSRYR